MTVYQRYKYHQSLLMYKAVQGTAPDYICDMFTNQRDVSQRTTRSSSDDRLYMPRPRTAIMKKSIRCAGVDVWNSLPADIRESPGEHIFKAKLKAYMLA